MIFFWLVTLATLAKSVSMQEALPDMMNRIYLLPLRVFTRAGIENGEHELGEKPHALNLISYQDHGFSRLATYITSIPEYSSSESINSS